jgi:hypothetical protein
MSEYILTHKHQAHEHQTHNHAASGWRIHCGVEVTELITNKQRSLSRLKVAEDFLLELLARSLGRIRGALVRRRHASHITVVLSKAAHSGPSVCLASKSPLPTSRILSASEY